MAKKPAHPDDPTPMSVPQFQEFAANVVRALPAEMAAKTAQILMERPGLLKALLRRGLLKVSNLQFDQRYVTRVKVDMIDTVAALKQTEVFGRLVPGAGDRRLEGKMLGWQKQLLHELRCADSDTITKQFQPYMVWSLYLPWTTEEMEIQGESRGLRLATPQALIALCDWATTEPPRESRLVSLIPIVILNTKYYLTRVWGPRDPTWELVEESVRPWGVTNQALFVGKD